MNSPRKKIYFASDAHLGARFHKDPLAVEKRLVRWLDSIKDEAMAIYFLGDMFDYWYEYKYVVPKGFVRFLGKLAELSDNGVEIHIFIGNHDIWMFDYLPQEIGAVIHRDVLTSDLLGKRFSSGTATRWTIAARRSVSSAPFSAINSANGCMPASIPGGRSDSLSDGRSAAAKAG